jgi:hypothetical protein
MNYRLDRKYTLFLFVMLFFIGCAKVGNSVDAKVKGDEPYGFLSGFFHGFTLLFSWVGTLFSDEIAIYDCNNNGGWYDFGFFLGVFFTIGLIVKANELKKEA